MDPYWSLLWVLVCLAACGVLIVADHRQAPLWGLRAALARRGFSVTELAFYLSFLLPLAYPLGVLALARLRRRGRSAPDIPGK